MSRTVSLALPALDDVVAVVSAAAPAANPPVFDDFPDHLRPNRPQGIVRTVATTLQGCGTLLAGWVQVLWCPPMPPRISSQELLLLAAARDTAWPRDSQRLVDNTGEAPSVSLVPLGGDVDVGPDDTFTLVQEAAI
jgi:hypothetical protein